MFFEITDFAISGVSAFEISWKENIGFSSLRPYHALSFRIVGDAEFSKDEEMIRVGSGDITFVPAFCKYHLTAGAERLYVIHFSTDVPILGTIKKFSVNNDPLYRQCFEDIVKTWSEKGVGYEHECKHILYKIIMNMERESERKKITGCSGEMQKALDYIHRHFTERTLSVSELAKGCSMSETYFRKLFAALYGCSPLEYINARRLEHAIELLKTRYYTVAEVSEMCGFSTPYYFSSFVKKKTGHSPMEFMQ